MPRKTKNIIKISSLFLSLLFIIVYSVSLLPQTVYFTQDNPDNIYYSNLPVTVSLINNSTAVGYDATDNEKNDLSVCYNLFGFIPIKRASVTKIGSTKLIPSGAGFGVKFHTDGVMVVGMTDFETSQGTVNPAFDAGIRIGDLIISINGKKVFTTSEIASIVSSSDKSSLKVKIKRNNLTFDVDLVPKKALSDGIYKIGLWVRDSTAGIGTITYINPTDNTFGGLGHGIYDVDTNKLMPLHNGEIVGVNITGVKKSKKGIPGEICGTLNTYQSIGVLSENSENGVKGALSSLPKAISNSVEIGLKNQVHTGDAIIYCTLDENGPKAYKIKVTKIFNGISDGNKNMLIEVTDPDLLKITGGIVQGMSGSPIIQDGKLIGAVTHVLVNSPTQGYGIFIENMLADQSTSRKAS